MSEPAPLGISFPNILFQLVNFVVFLWILRRLLYGPGHAHAAGTA